MGGQDNLGHNMMGQDAMGRNIYNVMSNRGMTADVSNMISQQMKPSMMGRDMTMNVMSRNMLGHQEMTPNTMYSNMMDMSNNQMSSNMINSRGMSSDQVNAHSNNGVIGQRMMQRMEIEGVPETYTSTRFF